MSKNAASSSMWMMGLSIGEKAFAFAIYVILARLLDIIEFGIVAFCALFLDFLVMLISTGVREYIVTRKEISKLFINTCFISIMVGAVVVVGVFSQLFMLFLPDDASLLLEQVFQVLIFLPLLAGFNTVQIALLQRDFKFKQLAIRSMISTVVAGITSVWFAYDGYGAWALVIYKYMLVILDTIILFYITRFLPSLQFSFEIFKGCYRFSIPLIMSEVFNFWSSRIMELFVSLFFGPASFALLDVARKFSKLIQQVSLTALRPVCLSFVAKALPENKGTAHSAFTSYVTVLVAPIMILLGVYADSYVALVFGPQWVKAVSIIEILSFTAAAQCLTWYFSLLLIANNQTKQVFTLNLIFFALSVAAGAASYSLSFEQYIIVQVAVINLLSIVKIVYLLKTSLISITDIKNYILPVVISLGFFVISSLALKRFVFEQIKYNNVLDLFLVSGFSFLGFVLYGLFCFLVFKSFSRNIVISLKTIRK